MIHWLVAAAFAAPSPLIDLTPPAPSTGERPGAFDAPPAFQWRARLPGPPMNTSVHSEHARPLVADEHGLLVGSAAGDGLYLLSRRDGIVLSHFPADGSSVESPATWFEDRVIFTDVGGRTWSYQLDGTFLWKHVSGAPILVEPVVHDGLVFVTNVDDLAVALDAHTGELAWRYQHPKDLSREAELALYAAPPAVIVEDEVLLGFSDGTLVGLEYSGGEKQWSKPIGEGRYPDLVAEPVAYGPDLYTSGYYKPLVALDKEGRDVRWRLDNGAANPPVVDDRDGSTAAVLYHPGSDGTLRAVSTLTGAVKWTWDSDTDGALTTPVITDAGLVLGSSEGGVYLIDPETGTERWRVHEDRLLLGVSSTPVVDGRQLFFVTNAGWLYAFVVP